MALYFLNCSVDAPDHFFKYERPANPINDQESIVEILVEKVLGFEHAIADCDAYDETQKMQVKKTISLDFFLIAYQSLDTHVLISGCTRTSFDDQVPALVSRPHDMHAPPPEI